jgi:hypothetical protein
MRASNTLELISLLAESAERIGFRMLASPMDAVMYSIRRFGNEDRSKYKNLADCHKPISNLD